MFCVEQAKFDPQVRLPPNLDDFPLSDDMPWRSRSANAKHAGKPEGSELRGMIPTTGVNQSPTQDALPIEQVDRRGQILAAIARVLEESEVPYCIPHGHEFLPTQVTSDAVLIIERAALPDRLAALLEKHADRIGAHVIQWIEDRDLLVVLSDARNPGSPHLLQLQVMPDFAFSNRLFYTGTEILDSRFTRKGVAIPAAEIEFGCILCNRIADGELDDQRAARLSDLYSLSPLACEREASRFLSAASAVLICLAAHSRDWYEVNEALPQLRRELLSGTPTQSNIIGSWICRLKRWANPAGAPDRIVHAHRVRHQGSPIIRERTP